MLLLFTFITGFYCAKSFTAVHDITASDSTPLGLTLDRSPLRDVGVAAVTIFDVATIVLWKLH